MPVWFLLDGDDLVFNTGTGTVKGRALSLGTACDGKTSIYVAGTITRVVSSVSTAGIDLSCQYGDDGSHLARYPQIRGSPGGKLE